MRKLVRSTLYQFQTKEAQNCIAFHVLFQIMAIKQALLQPALKFVHVCNMRYTMRLVCSKLLCAKVLLCTKCMRKQRVNELYYSRSKSRRLTNYCVRIVMPGLRNGSWLAKLWDRKSLSCIDKQKVENYFMRRIPNYFLDVRKCTKKTPKRVKTIRVIKLEIKDGSLSLPFKLLYSIREFYFL